MREYEMDSILDELIKKSIRDIECKTEEMLKIAFGDEFRQLAKNGRIQEVIYTDKKTTVYLLDGSPKLVKTMRFDNGLVKVDFLLLGSGGEVE